MEYSDTQKKLWKRLLEGAQCAKCVLCLLLPPFTTTWFPEYYLEKQASKQNCKRGAWGQEEHVLIWGAHIAFCPRMHQCHNMKDEKLWEVSRCSGAAGTWDIQYMPRACLCRVGKGVVVDADQKKVRGTIGALCTRLKRRNLILNVSYLLVNQFSSVTRKWHITVLSKQK